MKTPEIKDSIEEKEELISKHKEKIWSDAFWSEYKPNFNQKNFFLKVKEYFYDELSKPEKKIFKEILSLAEWNNYRLDINFLESLNINQKKYFSWLLYNIFRYSFREKFETIGKSLFIWIYRWKCCDWWKYYGDRDILSEISENFEWFDVDYFWQAYNYLTYIWDRDIFHILQEYNLIKNLDNDMESPDIKDSLDLWEGFSLWTFHARSTIIWYWLEKKYWMYDLDSKWQETNLSQTWDVSMLDSEGEDVPYAYVLDRNDESVYKDASGESYNEYLDAPTWIALFYQWKPIACICFFINNWSEIFINQIQKVVHYNYDRYGRCTWKSYSKITDKIDWKKTLYDVIIKLARKYSIPRIVIQWWENNRWIEEEYKDYETDYFRNCVSIYIDDSYPKPHEWKLHLTPEIAHKIYDVFAQWLWFIKNADWNREKEI